MLSDETKGLRARPKINFAYVIIGVAAIIMLAALLSAPRIRKYAREKARAAKTGTLPASAPANGNQSP